MIFLKKIEPSSIVIQFFTTIQSVANERYLGSNSRPEFFWALDDQLTNRLRFQELPTYLSLMRLNFM
jgi:hypothetical protein